jgi:hypothetical protein
MATLRAPKRRYSFTDHYLSRPRDPPPGTELDAQFADLREAIISTQQCLSELRRDDGQLVNASVGRHQLKPALVDEMTGDVRVMITGMTRAVESAISAQRISVNEIALLAKDAENAAVAAAQFLSAIKNIEGRLLAATQRAEVASTSVDVFATDAENWANYSQAQAENAAKSEDNALAWAEYLAGPVIDNAHAADFIAQSPYPHGLFYQPVQGFGGTGGLWSAKWWAIYCQQLVGFISFYYLGGWDHPPAPGEVNPDTGQQVPEPLAPGSIYYDEIDGTLKVWTGETWHEPFALTGGLTSRFTYKATAGQTVFSGADIFGVSPTLDATMQHDVHVNGVKWVRDDGTGKGDYTVNVATSALTLLTPVTVNSVVQWDLLVSPIKLAPGAATIYKMNTLVPDGTTTAFTLTYAGPGGTTAAAPTKPAELLVVLDGVPQEPITDYTTSGSTLNMIAAPGATSRMWVVWFKPGGP